MVVDQFWRKSININVFFLYFKFYKIFSTKYFYVNFFKTFFCLYKRHSVFFRFLLKSYLSLEYLFFFSKLGDNFHKNKLNIFKFYSTDSYKESQQVVKLSNFTVFRRQKFSINSFEGLLLFPKFNIQFHIFFVLSFLRYISSKVYFIVYFFKNLQNKKDTLKSRTIPYKSRGWHEFFF